MKGYGVNFLFCCSSLEGLQGWEGVSAQPKPNMRGRAVQFKMQLTFRRWQNLLFFCSTTCYICIINLLKHAFLHAGHVRILLGCYSIWI